MQRLIVLNNPRMAQAFIDYMASRQIDLRMMPEGEGQFALWLMDDQHWVETEAELKQFLANPGDSKYSAASWDMAETRKTQFQLPKSQFTGDGESKSRSCHHGGDGRLCGGLRVHDVGLGKPAFKCDAFSCGSRATMATMALGEPCSAALLGDPHCV